MCEWNSEREGRDDEKRARAVSGSGATEEEEGRGEGGGKLRKQRSLEHVGHKASQHVSGEDSSQLVTCC